MQYRVEIIYLQAVTSRQDVTWCRSCRGQGASRHVTSGRDRRRRGQGERHVTSRQLAAVDKEAVDKVTFLDRFGPREARKRVVAVANRPKLRGPGRSVVDSMKAYSSS